MNTLTLRCRVSGWAAALATVMVLVLVPGPAPARADQPPAFTSGPALEGQATVGAELRIVASWRGDPPPAWSYGWQRCDASGLFCDVIDGACAATHVVSADDVGSRLQGEVNLFNAAGALSARTPLSDLIVGEATSAVSGSNGPSSRPCTLNQPPGTAPAPPSQPPPATPTRQPQPEQQPDVAGRAQPKYAYMRPFPVVRIRGYSVARGAHITMLSVSGNRSARVRATCLGAACPAGVRPAVHPPARLRALERFFPAGTVLQIRVTTRGTIGKYTSFRILAGRAPRRLDRCLLPGRWMPVRCPAG